MGFGPDVHPLFFNAPSLVDRRPALLCDCRMAFCARNNAIAQDRLTAEKCFQIVMVLGFAIAELAPAQLAASVRSQKRIATNAL